MARVTKCVKGNEGNPRVIEHPALFSDHSLYEFLFSNGQTEELTLNVISENILSQVYSEVHRYQLLKDISDHSADGSTLKSSDGFIRIHDGNLHPKNTIRGCKLEVEWMDGSLSRIPSKDIKASNIC